MGPTLQSMLTALSINIHRENVEKGFYEGDKNTGEMLCLIHSEISEALEADRKDSYYPGPTPAYTMPDHEFKDFYDSNIKGTFEEEMADAMIRIFDLCGFKKIDIGAHVAAKLRYNAMRPHKHGKKY